MCELALILDCRVETDVPPMIGEQSGYICLHQANPTAAHDKSANHRPFSVQPNTDHERVVHYLQSPWPLRAMLPQPSVALVLAVLRP